MNVGFFLSKKREEIPCILTMSGRFRVLEWHTVTVAWFHFNRSAIGDPTILLRPKTTAFFPATDTPDEKDSKTVKGH